MRRVLILFMVGWICFSGFLPSANAQYSERFSRHIFKGANGDTLRYRMLYPDYDTLRKYPLIIFLHGSGERGNDNTAQLKWGVMNFASDEMMSHFPALVVAPQCPSGLVWANFSENEKTRELRLQPDPSNSMALLHALIRQLINEMPVDTCRIYITGLSMGGFGTFDAIVRYPGLFAAAVPVCGGGDCSRAGDLVNLPLWIFHGAEDSGVNPLYAIDMIDALTKTGAHPGLTYYPETGHFAWLAAYNDKLMMTWLFRQRRR